MPRLIGINVLKHFSYLLCDVEFVLALDDIRRLTAEDACYDVPQAENTERDVKHEWHNHQWTNLGHESEAQHN